MGTIVGSDDGFGDGSLDGNGVGARGVYVGDKVGRGVGAPTVHVGVFVGIGLGLTVGSSEG